MDHAVTHEPLPARMLNEYAYCPRLFYFMHVEQLWSDNQFTEDGKRVHRRVDRIDHVLEPPSPSGDPALPVGDDAPTIARSVTLTCPQLGLTAKLDLVSTDGDEAVPVETKRGRVPDNAEQSWEPERVQLMAQALLLRAHGYRSDHGFLYFAASRRRVEIIFTPALEQRTRELLIQAQALAKSNHLPDPLEDSPKCKGCSLAGICLPDETLALRHVPKENPSSEQPTVRRLYPPRDDASPFYVQEPGAWVGTSKGTIVVKKDGELLAEAKLKDLDHLVLCGNVQIGTQAVHLLCEAGIPICYVSMGHWFYGFTSGFALRNAYDRAAQFRTAELPEKCLSFARAVVVAKGANQRTLLRRNADPAASEALEAMAHLFPVIEKVTEAESLLGVEGTLARHYFSAFSRMIKPGELAEGFDQEGRARRPPPDPVNALLSFGYALLAKECTVALAAVGLDPFWGFYHKPRHGRPALALDLMEEFRPLIVDSAVITACNTGMVTRSDCIIGKNGCLLKDTARKSFIRAYEARLEQLATHPTLGYRVSWRVMIRLQARLLGRWLRGDIPVYEGITTR
jgi:CRISP-associated protein Cas1